MDQASQYQVFLRRFFWAIGTIFVAMSLIFFALRAAPGDPAIRILGPEADPLEIEKIRSELGLDQPLLIQFVSYWEYILQGNLGESLILRKSVKILIQESLLPTLELAMWAILLSAFLGIGLGVFSTQVRNPFLEKIVRFGPLMGLSFPIYSLAPALIYLLAILIPFFPVSEWTSWKHKILPVLTLGIPLSAVMMRVTRYRFLEDDQAQWLQILKGKGLSPYQILRKRIKIIMPTCLNVLSLQLSVLLSGTIITETIFDIPGIGLLLFEGIQSRDYPLVQGIFIYICIIYLLIYFLVDSINVKIDPRIAQ